jgi:hypothetical protein|tara:strand:+ start:2348 stop:3721 length:1374 start_codon:yes stop_codon:yes gene_type:complete
MPVKIKGFDEQGGYNNQNQNENLGGGPGGPESGDVFIDAGGTGGGSSSGGSVVTPTTTNTFVFTITSNETGFTTSVNNVPVPTNQSVRISRESLATEDKLIKIAKKGYKCDEYYVVTMVDDDLPLIKNKNVSDTPLGISTKDIVLKKFVNGEEQLPVSIRNITSKTLTFNLTKGEVSVGTSLFTIKFNIGEVEGAPVSVVKNSKTSAEFFPKTGQSVYEDLDNTKYLIRSSDTTLYRISGMTISKDGNTPTVLEADANETLETTITLNTDYEVSITIQQIPVPDADLDPQISLVKTDPRKYNINEKSGVPLLIQKNKDVQAITIIVGDDILEFDELDDSDIIGITIPHKVFSKIGQYNIKLFPFSFNDYENQVREAEEPITIKPKEVKPKFEGIETEKPVDKPKPVKNPYNPPRGGGGGGGGREEIISDDSFDYIDRFGGPNAGEEPGRPNRNLNYL